MTATTPQRRPDAAGGAPATVNDVVPPRCFTCNAPLTTKDELNRLIDFGMDICGACIENEEDDACSCVYGWYLGGDPRQFEPDGETNTEAELETWRAACAAWEQGKAVEPASEEHGPWIAPDGTVTLGVRPSAEAIGVCRAPRAYGMGAQHCEQHKQPSDAWRGWPTRLEPLPAEEAAP